MTVITNRPRRRDQTAPPRMLGSIELLALSATEWRVRNAALPEGDGSSVLGLVQLIGDTYEVMQMGAPLTRYYFASLEDAVDYLARSQARR